MDVPVVATPTLVVWETEDVFRAKEEQYDRAAPARCVRLATQNAYLTLQS